MQTYSKRTYWKDFEMDEVEQEQAMLRYSSRLRNIAEYELANLFKQEARDYSENLYPSTRQFKYHG